ncbi:hypothetical protein J3L18_05790 [Mucilaginibacter gossypii]|uniref:hypothetical protein n=1 Tax=Mucilaginibacter gossypii TaxID=551996 RepID=UPI000DCB165E|nr:MULTISPECIES: hypothetical protein [Mucilaginibacter]QTE38585.1 hypothetical protein J3L18_05790 [Mucilaginibacter gossypii]RAV55340.1 hypothetical protein DIU36_19320 [Mucilaginibacter rubeus]
MKLRFLLLMLFSIVAFAFRSHAKDVEINMDSLRPTYSVDLKKAFNINFSNSKKDDNVLIQISTDDFGTQDLRKGIPDGKFNIAFTIAGGKLNVQNIAGKTLAITGNFSLKIGPKNIDIVQEGAAEEAQAVDQIIFVKLDNIGKYSSNFDHDLKIDFDNNTDQSGKTNLKVNSEGKEYILKQGVKDKHFTVDLRSSKSKLTVKDKDNKLLALSAPIKMTFGAIKITIDSIKKSEQTPTPSNEGPAAIPYWEYLKDEKFSFSLSEFRKIESCSEECPSCDDGAFNNNNQLIYDARSGLTYFVKSTESNDLKSPVSSPDNNKFVVSSKKNIVLSAGDPLVLVVKNVNPLLYDITLADSSMLVNNKSNSTLNNLIINKSDMTFAQGANLPKELPVEQRKDYYKVKAALLVIQAEMYQTLEFYRKNNLYLHNCVVQKKREALSVIDAALNSLLGKRYQLSLLQALDLFLDQTTADSTLNHQIKSLYGEFVAANYTIAHRLGNMPEQDIMQLRLAIVAKKNSPYPSLISTTKQRPTQTVYIKNFFKIDVSSGLYLGSGRDENYAFRSTLSTSVKTVAGKDSTVNQLYKENDGKRELGFASFLHFYPKFGTSLNASLTLGAGLSLTQTVRPRYFTGASILYGSHNRFCVNFGAVWGSYQQLSDKYIRENNSFKDLPISESAVTYKSTFKGSFFVSISYNLAFLTGTSEAKTTSQGKSGQ